MSRSARAIGKAQLQRTPVAQRGRPLVRMSDMLARPTAEPMVSRRQWE